MKLWAHSYLVFFYWKIEQANPQETTHKNIQHTMCDTLNKRHSTHIGFIFLFQRTNFSLSSSQHSETIPILNALNMQITRKNGELNHFSSVGNQHESHETFKWVVFFMKYMVNHLNTENGGLPISVSVKHVHKQHMKYAGSLECTHKTQIHQKKSYAKLAMRIYTKKKS